MKKTFLLTTALLLATSTAYAEGGLTEPKAMPAGVYAIEKHHASLIWKVSHLGLSNYAARFKHFEGDLTFNPTDVTKSKIVATIDPTSVETDYVPDAKKDFNKELAEGENWFNAKKFPQIRFESTRIEKTGDKTGKIHGNLTFLGVTKPVTLDAVFNGAYALHPFMKVPIMGFSATGSLKRSDWGMSSYLPMIGDEVSFQIEAELIKKEGNK